MTKISWGLFLILSFIITLPISWWGLAKADFAYSYWHDAINISAHIDRYAPRNIKNKLHFELTTKEERVDLFHQTILAIQNNGEGLSALKYQDKTTQQQVSLYTQAEVIHLKDVAHLLSTLKWLVLGLLVFWLFLVVILWQKKIRLPTVKQLFLSTVLILTLCGAILLLGPEVIFNQLHVWVFPDEHQWFFYYEESLMSTMMKAPDLFAYIAGVWGLLSLIFTLLILTLVKSVLNTKTSKKWGGVL